MKHFLESSEQCPLSKSIIDLANAIDGESFYFILQLLKWINKNIKYPQPANIEKNDIFRKRTATQIIEDGYATGCSDFAIVFIAIARAKHIPTKYVEVISEDYFEDTDLNRVRGHVFAECFIDKEWFGVDPMAGVIKFNTKYPGYVVYAKGLDSWDLGIFDIDSMRVKFKEFANQYKSKHIS